MTADGPTRPGVELSLVDVVVDHLDRAVVRVGDWFVKVETDPARAEREHELLGWAPVPVPEVQWYRPGRPRCCAAGTSSRR